MQMEDQPFLCNELGNFQAIFSNLLGPFSGDFWQFQAIFRQFSGNSQAISGNLGF